MWPVCDIHTAPICTRGGFLVLFLLTELMVQLLLLVGWAQKYDVGLHHCAMLLGNMHGELVGLSYIERLKPKYLHVLLITDPLYMSHVPGPVQAPMRREASATSHKMALVFSARARNMAGTWAW
jgi:hypothetical protein